MTPAQMPTGGRAGRRRTSRGGAAVVAAVAYVALFCAMAWPAQSPEGWTQNAHFALVRALADGTPQIDRYAPETGDESYVDGHYYSAKAPGVAIVALPAYVALDAAGLWPDGRRAALWLLALITSALPALALVWLVARVAESLEPGSGLAVGLTLGIGTLVLPFSTLAFSHIWSALLAFACFAVLLHERRGSGRLGLVVAAGLLSGLGVLFEYPTALAGLVLGILAVARRGWLLRGIAYTGGVLGGLVPLLAYNRWAFGSPFTLSYANAIVVKGQSGHDVVGAHSEGLFGITAPSLRTLAELLVSDRGLLVVTPVVAAGVAGLVLLLRAGDVRAAAWPALAICVAFPVYNAGVTTPFGGAFGGASPGPRYLATALPFALCALGVAYRRARGPVLALAAVSAAAMAVATATGPLVGAGQGGLWWHVLAHGMVVPTVVGLLGWSGPVLAAALPFFVCVVVVGAIAARSFVALSRPALGDLAGAAAGIGAWLFALLADKTLLRDDPTLVDLGLAIVVLAAAGLLVVIAVAQEPAVGRGREAHPGGAPSRPIQ